MTAPDFTGVPHIRTSERKDYKRCPQRWAWAWRQGLKPRIEKPGPLWFGTGMHLALQHRYKYRGKKRGSNVLQVWRDYVGDTEAVIFGENFGDDKSDFYNAKDLGEEMLGGYLDLYGKDDRWFVLSAEQSFELPIPYPKNYTGVEHPSGLLALYNGTFDLVALDEEADDSVWMWDHKNMKQISTAHLQLDDQAGSYWAVAGDVLASLGLIEPGMKLDGILYNYLRKAHAESRPTNSDGLVTNKPTKAHYIFALARHEYDGEVWEANDAAITKFEKMTLPQLQHETDALGLAVLGDPSKNQPSPNFIRYPVWRTSSERRTQIQRIQNEALNMEAHRSRLLPLIKNPTTDCSWDCDFFNLCQLHEAGDDWREFKAASFVKKDPYADHRVNAPNGKRAK